VQGGAASRNCAEHYWGPGGWGGDWYVWHAPDGLRARAATGLGCMQAALGATHFLAPRKRGRPFLSRHLPSAIRHPPSAICHPPSAIRHPPFLIPHSPFRIPKSKIPNFQWGGDHRGRTTRVMIGAVLAQDLDGRTGRGGSCNGPTELI